MKEIIENLQDQERLLHLECKSAEDKDEKELYQLAYSCVQEAVCYLDDINNL